MRRERRTNKRSYLTTRTQALPTKTKGMTDTPKNSKTEEQLQLEKSKLRAELYKKMCCKICGKFFSCNCIPPNPQKEDKDYEQEIKQKINKPKE